MGVEGQGSVGPELVPNCWQTDANYPRKNIWKFIGERLRPQKKTYRYHNLGSPKRNSSSFLYHPNEATYETILVSRHTASK